MLFTKSQDWFENAISLIFEGQDKTQSLSWSKQQKPRLPFIAVGQELVVKFTQIAGYSFGLDGEVVCLSKQIVDSDG